jgi:methyl-accepting chemotaxis protein
VAVRGRAHTNAVSRWLANLATRTKFLLALAGVAAAAVGVGGIAVAGMSSMQTRSDAIYHEHLTAIDLLAQTRTSSLIMRGRVTDAIISLNAAQAQGFITKYQTESAKFDATFNSYATSAPADRAAQIAAVREATSKVRQVWQTTQIPNALRHDVTAFATVRDTQILPLFTALQNGLTALTDAEKQAAAAAHAASRHTATAARRNVIITLAVALAAGTGFAMYLAWLMVTPLRRVVAVLGATAEGDLTQTVGADSRDEIGQMADALDRATARLRTTIGMVGHTSFGLATSADELALSATRISGSAGQASTEAATASVAAEQISRNVQTVAAASEEMGSSIREIATNAGDAARVAKDAVGIAQDANTIVGQLGQASTEIGAVVKTITAIAEQTNLLALNATIEAARAGEAGKGFAVVAGEVKDLAQETAKATGDISHRVEAIQANTHAAVQAIVNIARVIEQINQYSTTIASAVEEQTSVTNEISRNITQAATGATTIAANITAVATATTAATTDVAATSSAADQLAATATQLQHVVAQFRY